MSLIKLLLLFCVGTNSYCLAESYNVAVIGTGYVGLVLGACLGDFGHKVNCADIDTQKINLLNKGEIPIFEPGLKELVHQVVNRNNLSFTSNVNQAIQNADVVFIAVGTPMDTDGQADLSAVKAVAKVIGQNLNKYKLICTKSTVPIGTGKIIKNIIQTQDPKVEFDVASNPEFLREGSAVLDFLQPDRIVIGVESEKAKEILYGIYQPLMTQNVPMVTTDIATAEMIKYASNSFLATKISFINEIANLCEATGANVKMVSLAMGLDNRIGRHFLNPGPGFGGSCFPKDAEALLFKGRSAKVDLKVLKAALETNEVQKLRMFTKLKNLLNNNLKNKTIAVLGLAFKANTDDVRYSPSITFIEQILAHNGIVKAYDPAATDNMKKIFSNLQYCATLEETVKNADAIAIMTEWEEFRTMDLAKIRTLVHQPIILDTRNILNTTVLANLGFKFENVGNAQVNQYNKMLNIIKGFYAIHNAN